ncbi:MULTISPECIES: cytochrome P450 [Mycolicibacter]|uniref:Cytochrome P450 n=1 Tax=Mycolicibacter kumamotonensis TaxID=354243 RepID=A0A7K3L746_9MYCO|nr:MULTISPECIES: cytochrome P450 [Mycolicibacter]NDJ88013.1 cytochrome P450 [Mycolicibacter kumamotonensis]RAV02826.1 cytochrome P450 [Mycolicibacter senuensis]
MTDTRPHTQPRSTIDLDHHSPKFREDPYGPIARLRESGCPVAHSEHHGGFWALMDYASVFDAARDDDLFNSYPTVGVPPSGMPFPILPIESDPPQTKELRDVTLRQFSPKAAETARPMATAIANELIDSFIERGTCDIVAEFTTPLPARVILRMLKWDESRYRDWVQWVHTLVHDRSDDPEKAGIAGMELFGEIAKQLQARRAEGLGDDLFSDILRGTLDGTPLDDTQITMYGFLMMLGGMDTTSGLTGNVLLRLCQEPQLRKELTNDPSLLAQGTDEFLRHCTPVVGQARTVSRETRFHGQQLQAGERALLMWAAANRDPTVFENPDTLDLRRPNARKHLSFGVGIHRCLGSHFARMMFQVMVDHILQRLPDFELAGEYERFPDAGEVNAVRRLPIKFTPGQALRR